MKALWGLKRVEKYLGFKYMRGGTGVGLAISYPDSAKEILLRKGDLREISLR